MKTRIVSALICLCFAGLAIRFGQLTTDGAQFPLASYPITAPDQRAVLAEATKDLDLAQARYDNILLKLRLALHVPNDYNWDRRSESFLAPPPKPKPSASPLQQGSKRDPSP